MLRVRQMEALQKSASVHASLHNRFSRERNRLNQTFKQRRSTALVQWQSLAS